MRELVEKMLAGNQQALARLISMVERESNEVTGIMEEIYPHTGKAYSIGITGPPGGGKSTMVDKLAATARKKGLTVGIIAVDPTSPFTGGAVLGDRIRMQQHYLDEGVFIRSMATRGSHGGLPRAAKAVLKLIDASGKDIILVETVGVGQTELDIMETVDASIVVLVPEAGDTIQTMKAGLMEIADIFAVNKADRPGAEYLMSELELMLHQSPRQSWWDVPVVTTQAVNNIGIPELYGHIERYQQALHDSGMLAEKRKQQRKSEFIHTIERTIMNRVTSSIESEERLVSYIEKVEEGNANPYSAAREILSDRKLIETWICMLKEL